MFYDVTLHCYFNIRSILTLPLRKLILLIIFFLILVFLFYLLLKFPLIFLRNYIDYLGTCLNCLIARTRTFFSSRLLWFILRCLSFIYSRIIDLHLIWLTLFVFNIKINSNLLLSFIIFTHLRYLGSTRI